MVKKRKLGSLNDLPAVASYLRRIGAEPTSFNIAEIIDRSGKYPKTLVRIKFHIDGAVDCDVDHHAPTEEEVNAFALAFADVEFPEIVKLASIDKPPAGIDIKDDSIFIFRDINNQIVMLAQRVDRPDGTKYYLPYTFWSDGEWRQQSPELIPIWGMPQMKDNSIAFAHEGPGGARHITRLLAMMKKGTKELPSNNPWLNEMANAAHLGWHGGAFAAHKVDWASLRKAGIKRLYIISDNDIEGRGVVPKIAEQFDIPVIHVQLDDRFDKGFDMADEFPEKLFKMEGNEKVYIGPSFSEAIHPATWATTMTMVDEKPVFTIRNSFAAQWSWVEQVDLYVNEEWPTIQLKRDQFNSSMAPFSHVRDTAGLLLKTFTGRKTTLTYRPDVLERKVIEDGETAVNLFRPTLIEPLEGSVKPFLDFMAYLFPNKEECEYVMRWCSTLVGRPDIRMAFGLLVVSENQGVGKTTLGDILADLVGRHNCSFPNESMIVDQIFTGWLANKRLCISNEIYTGHSWKAYHRLKTYITDLYIEVNIKHQKTYTIKNYAHFYVCSNSLSALKMEDQDRRWFMPKVVEISWKAEQFIEFRRWLNAGGIRKILHYMQTRTNYIDPGAVAPMTESKRYVIEESRSDAQSLAKKLGEIIMRPDKPAIVFQLAWLREWCGEQLNGKVFDNERSLGRQLKLVGATVLDQPIKIGGVSMRLASNRKELLNGKLDPETLKKAFAHPRDLYATEI